MAILALRAPLQGPTANHLYTTIVEERIILTAMLAYCVSLNAFVTSLGTPFPCQRYSKKRDNDVRKITKLHSYRIRPIIEYKIVTRGEQTGERTSTYAKVVFEGSSTRDVRSSQSRTREILA